jgi:hypothetical protein
LAFGFDPPPPPAMGTASLAGLEQRINRDVGTALKGDPRPREVVAAEMSVLLGETVSKEMLDAYASPARVEHKVPISRYLALLAVTGRQDMLDPRLREIGAAVLVGEEVHTARLGQIDRQIKQLQAERRTVAGQAPLIRRGGTDGQSGI